MIHTFILQHNKELVTDVSFEELRKSLKDKDKCVWVDFEKPTEEERNVLTDVFNFHPLAIEDCTNTNDYPKVDNFENYLFIIMHAVDFNSREKELATLELDIFLGKNYVVTYHSRSIKSVIQTKERCLRDPLGVMGKGADLLVYTIIDALADNFIPTLNTLDYRIDEIEEEIFVDDPDFLNKIVTIRNDIINLRKIIRPQRNTLNMLTRGTLPFIHKDNVMYFRDIYDQLYRISEQSDGYRDMISGILDTHLSVTSHRMNRIMKILTIVMTVMLPLTLITGIYGMNFKHMPALESPYGYLSILGLMFSIAFGLIFYMKKKKWF